MARGPGPDTDSAPPPHSSVRCPAAHVDTVHTNQVTSSGSPGRERPLQSARLSLHGLPLAAGQLGALRPAPGPAHPGVRGLAMRVWLHLHPPHCRHGLQPRPRAHVTRHQHRVRRLPRVPCHLDPQGTFAGFKVIFNHSVFQVPSDRQMIVNVQNVSFTCPGLQLNIRDGVETRDTLLYTIHVDTNVSVSVRTSGHVSRLELVSDTWNMNSSLCYAVMHVGVIIKGNLS